jgi:diadenosine tetraphosphate (Ap4A) HIT family hydrolase
LADPIVESLNTMTRGGRIQYSLDMVEAGDAVLAVTEAYRINYETLGNAEPALHTHIIPRYRGEPEDKRRRPAWVGYDWATSRRFDPVVDGRFVEAVRARLSVGDRVHDG